MDSVHVPARLFRELVDRAREMTAASKGTERSRTAREWELRCLLRCRCGWRMRTHSALRRNGTIAYYYYDCNKHGSYDREACPQKLLRAEEVEDSVWRFVSGLLKEPVRIRLRMEALIEKERGQPRGDPAREALVWADKVEECTRLRKAYQRQQAVGLMSLAELGEAL